MSTALTTSASLSSGVILDSLPYVETVHEDHEEYALALIEEEMKRAVPRPMKQMRPLTFRTPKMQTEYETIVVDGKIEERKNHFKKAVTRSGELSEMKSLYESERIRGLVLEAEKEEGVATWKDYSSSLDELAKFWTKLLEREVETVEETNFKRQQAQTQQVGPELERLNQEYQQALYRRNQLEHAVEGLRRTTELKNNSNDDTTRKRKVQE